MDILSFDFDKMSPLELELVKKTTQKWREDGLASMDRRHYYPMANDCQIRDLAEHYEILFGKKDNGVFVEIGAFDGQEVSNTAGLADLGWRGVYVEPVPSFSVLCRARHPGANIDVLPYCVGREETNVSFTVSDWNALSTAHPIMAEHLQAKDKVQGSIIVHQKTINQILQETAIAPGFDLFILDVEGNEYEALLGFDIAYYRPQVMIIELHDLIPDHPMAALHAETRRYIQNQNYRPYLIEGVNTIFLPY